MIVNTPFIPSTLVPLPAMSSFHLDLIFELLVTRKVADLKAVVGP
jgi:hypothetical protein